jgi:hypothetical protein
MTYILKISITSLVDCKELGEYVRTSTRLKYSFAIKPLTPRENDLHWKDTVLKAYDDMQFAKP